MSREDNFLETPHIPGLEIGQVSEPAHHTGCTVVVAAKGAVAGVDVRGGAPGTHGTDALRPTNLVDRVHAVVLAGGSAFGLAAVHGVMRYLRQRGCGFATAYGPVPIVSGAVVFDLGLNSQAKYPDAEMGYRACEAAAYEVGQGCTGAGTGATVGKLYGIKRAMKSGQGFAALETAAGCKVWALAVVNAFGDVRDPWSGELLAGARTAGGLGLADTLAAMGKLCRLGGFNETNTVLGVVGTDAPMDKATATHVAKMAQAGVARAVVPAHTLYDGDTIFVLSTGDGIAVEGSVVGAVAAELMAAAIVRAIKQATSAGGLPAWADLATEASGNSPWGGHLRT